MSAAVKTYLDHWSGRLRVPGLGFKARTGERRPFGPARDPPGMIL